MKWSTNLPFAQPGPFKFTHARVWESPPSSESFAQFFPPLAGLGSLHFRILECVPEPQLLEQQFQELHRPQWPSTERGGYNSRGKLPILRHLWTPIRVCFIWSVMVHSALLPRWQVMTSQLWHQDGIYLECLECQKYLTSNEKRSNIRHFQISHNYCMICDPWNSKAGRH